MVKCRHLVTEEVRNAVEHCAFQTEGDVGIRAWCRRSRAVSCAVEALGAGVGSFHALERVVELLRVSE